MRRARLLAISALVVVLSCSGTESDFPKVEGWTQVGDVRIYDADNLWEYINGAAELFLEYDVHNCRTGDLASRGLVVTVDFYDMGTPLNAFGVFRREHPSKGMSLAGATEAVVSPPYQALLLKDATYVKVNAVEGELTETAGRELLEAIARALPGQTAYPAELGLLPPNGKVADTEGFKREAFLGLTELNNALYADYTSDGEKTWQGFVLLAAEGSSANATWNGLADEWDLLEREGVTALYREVPYVGLVGVVRSGRAVIGAAGAADQTELLRRLGRLTS
jgi:hypothetical protein